MKYTIRGYMLRHGLTLEEFFYRAWDATHPKAAGSYNISDVYSYRDTRAVPRYVEDFLHMVNNETVSVLYRVPRYA